MNEASANEEALRPPPPARSTPPPRLLCPIQSRALVEIHSGVHVICAATSDRPTPDGPGEVFQGQIRRVGLDPPSSFLRMGKKCCQGIFEKVRDKRCDELSGLRGEGRASSLHRSCLSSGEGRVLRTCLAGGGQPPWLGLPSPCTASILGSSRLYPLAPKGSRDQRPVWNVPRSALLLWLLKGPHPSTWGFPSPPSPF